MTPSPESFPPIHGTYPAILGWFGDAGSLEVWMRQSDLNARVFGKAWCLIRTD